jgi:hypothetical protein
MNLKQELVKQGWCWWYGRYASEDTVMEGLKEGSTRGEERIVGRLATGTPVGIAAGMSPHLLKRYTSFLYVSPLRLFCFPPMRLRSCSYPTAA